MTRALLACLPLLALLACDKDSTEETADTVELVCLDDNEGCPDAVSYTHLTLPTTPYV